MCLQPSRRKEIITQPVMHEEYAVRYPSNLIGPDFLRRPEAAVTASVKLHLIVGTA